jgi:hypothetical protein
VKSALVDACEAQRNSQEGNRVVLEADEWDKIKRALEALAGMVGFVQLMNLRYDDFPTDGHRVLEAMSALRAIEES